MPTLQTFSNCRIVMYPRDHAPPHVHVEFRDGDRCSVVIETLELNGSVRPAKKLAEALEWIEQNRELLLARWKEIVL